ncbi:hypothetical protein SAMN04487894_104341 [Niabella drilacis]|uniref:Uncharacterized protein n=1 Tax=Niabella drilacis (strain DSM 25811 / CCM 8410 / CCUG 62505 / LMG 26954 / E90) TaxID=1285928 RepID=A0A1G6QAF8_NIADE|nr:hypothetical protein SAMN04487894_104341 [Niabella drilacis]
MYSKTTGGGFYRIKNAGKPARNKTDAHRLKMPDTIAILISNVMMGRGYAAPGPGKAIRHISFARFRGAWFTIMIWNFRYGLSAKNEYLSFANPKPNL